MESIVLHGLTATGTASVTVAKCFNSGDHVGLAEFLTERSSVPMQMKRQDESSFVVQVATDEKDTVKQFLSEYFECNVVAPPLSSDFVASSAAPANLASAIASITLNNAIPAKETRPKARDWVLTVIGEELTTFLKKAVPLPGKNGRQLNIHFMDIPEKTLTDALDALARKGDVSRYGVDEVKHLQEAEANLKTARTQRSRVVGNLDQTSSVIAGLSAIRGEGGDAAKRRRFADRAMECFATSQRVAAYGLREAREVEENKNDDANSE